MKANHVWPRSNCCSAPPSCGPCNSRQHVVLFSPLSAQSSRSRFGAVCMFLDSPTPQPPPSRGGVGSAQVCTPPVPGGRGKGSPPQLGALLGQVRGSVMEGARGTGTKISKPSCMCPCHTPTVGVVPSMVGWHLAWWGWHLTWWGWHLAWWGVVPSMAAEWVFSSVRFDR